jgi:hypothetical protein
MHAGQISIAEDKLRTFEKISIFREQKIKQEFDKLENVMLAQRAKKRFEDIKEYK